MKKIKKITALLLSVIIILGAASGCTNKKSQGTNAGAGGIDTGNQLSVTVWDTQGTDYTPPTMPSKRFTEEWLINKTGVKIKNVYGNGGSQWETRFVRLLAGNDFPELVHCGSGQGAAHFAKCAEANKLWELTPELLQKYAPDLWKKIPQTMWKRISVNGKIYGIPYNFGVSKEIDPNIPENMEEYCAAVNTPVKGSNSALYIRDDILKILFPNAKNYDELTKIMETTNKPIADDLVQPIYSTEEFVKLLYKIKDMNLTENGRPVYAMGFSGGDMWLPLAQFGSDLAGYKYHSYVSTWNTKTQKIEVPLVEPIIKNTAKLEHQMILDKVIEPESLVHPVVQYKEKILRGQYAICVASLAGWLPTVNETLQKNGKNYKYVPFYTQVAPADGYSPIVQPTVWNDAVAITKTVSEKNLPQVLNWMNTFFTDEYEEAATWGDPKLGLYTQDKNGKRRFTEENKQKYNLDGISGNSALNGGMFTMKFLSETRYRSMFFNDEVVYNWRTNGGKFSTDSKYAANITVVPPCLPFSPEFANIPNVQKYWSTRETWENPFKLAFAASSPEEFDQLWEEAVKNMKGLIDVDTMAEQMTEVAKEYKKKYIDVN